MMGTFITVTLSDKLLEQVKKIAALHDQDVNQVTEAALADALAGRDDFVKGGTRYCWTTHKD